MSIDYLATLPNPQTAVVTPFDRRQLSDPKRPRDARALSRDRLNYYRATWVLSPEQAAIFRNWWLVTLVYGGSWFNATWPLPQGYIPAVFRFMDPPKWDLLDSDFWRVTATLEMRGRGLPSQEGTPTVASEIAWFDAINDPITGTLLHSNSGTGVCDSFAPGPVVTLYAGLIGWTTEPIVWSLIWTSGEDASPIISFTADNYAQIDWVAIDGTTFPVSPASIGELIVTASVNGVPIATGQRLIAVTSPPTVDYPSIAWGPEV